MSKRLTIKDISKDLNIHHSTVSRALRKDPRVKKETMEKVIAYAEKVGYQVNMNALHLRGAVKNVIAVIVPNINHYLFSNIISRITNMAYQEGFVVSVFQTNEKLAMEKNILNTVIQNDVAGVIASVSMETIEGSHFQELKKYKIPLVLFDRVIDSLSVPKVEVNNREILTMVVKKLHQDNRKNICYISGSPSVSVFANRQQGFSEAVDRYDLESRLIRIDHAFNLEVGISCAREILKMNKLPDGIISDSFLMSQGLMNEFRNQNIRIPEDVDIYSFGDDPAMQIVAPYIYSIKQPLSQLAEAAYQSLKLCIQDENYIRNVSFKAEIGTINI